MVFNLFRSNKIISHSTAQQDEDASPPEIRKPQHAERDARMSIPIAEREFYETIQARKRRSMMGLDFVSGSRSGSGSGSGKGKERSPLDYDSGEFTHSQFNPFCLSNANASYVKRLHEQSRFVVLVFGA
jgi:hypothetical protein